MKSCLLFAAVFVLGAGLLLGGIGYELATESSSNERSSGLAQHDENEQRKVPRMVEMVGLVIAFGAIYGAASWKYYHRNRDHDHDHTG